VNHPYKLILVDDEFIVRDGISRCVPWGDNGFELCGLFENGLDAMEYIENNPVDIVISDINMPKMDGLALSRTLSDVFPDITVLLLTGYDDFDYAREAVKNQVREFLLKPITADELSGVLSRIQREMDDFSSAKQQQALMQEKLEQSMPLLKEHFLYRLVSGRLEKSQKERRKDFFQWKDLQESYMVAILTMPENWTELERMTLAESVRNSLDDKDEVFSNREENFVLLFQGSEPDSLMKRGLQHLEIIFRRAVALQEGHIFAGYGEVVNHTDQLVSSYRGAASAVEYSRLLGVSQILSVVDVREKKSVSLETYNMLTSNIIANLKEGRRKESEQSLRDLISYMERHYLTSGEAAMFFARLDVQLSDFMMSMNLQSDEFSEFSFSSEKFKSLQQTGSYFLSLIKKIEDMINNRRHDLVLSRIDRAREIIAARYSENRFSLQDICNELYLSSSQFSLLFKEGTGQTFVEYLTSFRIEEAKKLLKTTDLKGYEIAESAGFSDPRYFSLLFKKHSGMTAMEYRRSLD